MRVVRISQQTLAVHSNAVVVAFDPLEAHSILEVSDALARVVRSLRVSEQTLAVRSNTCAGVFDTLEAHSTQTGHLPQGPAESQTGELNAVLDVCQDNTCLDFEQPYYTFKA